MFIHPVNHLNSLYKTDGRLYMKSISLILFLIGISILSIYFIWPDERNLNSYISFQNECIEVNGSIYESIERTLKEFPECKIANNGRYSGAKYIFVRCGNTPLIPSNFFAVENREVCQMLSSTGPTKNKIFRQGNILPDKQRQE